MADWIRQLITNLGSASVIVLAGMWYFQRKLNVHFREIERLAKLTAELQKERNEQRSAFLHKIMRLVSDCRKNLRRVMQSQEPDTIAHFQKSFERYTDFLYAWQLLASAELYELLHAYKKRVEQALSFAVEALGHGYAPDDQALTQLSSECDRVDEMHSVLQRAARNQFEQLERLVKL